MRKTRKIRENKKGINTILAALLMVVIVVVAAVMVYAWATGLLGTLLVHPTTGQENLSYVTNSATFSSGTNMTAYINNIGTANVTLATYFVKDSNGNQYQYTYTNQPTISPNKSVPISFPIANCTPACSYTGSGTGFTFQSGYSYTVLMVTTHNNQFTFQVTR